MKKLAFLISFFLLSIRLYGQQVTLGYDTINIITVKTGSSANQEIYTSTHYFFIKGKYYNASNFPFSPLGSRCHLERDLLYIYSYIPLTNQKANKKLMNTLKRALLYPIDYFPTSSSASPEILNLIAALKKNYVVEFFLSEQRIVAAYLMLDCESTSSMRETIYCSDMVISNRLPVILNAMKILK